MSLPIHVIYKYMTTVRGRAGRRRPSRAPARPPRAPPAHPPPSTHAPARRPPQKTRVQIWLFDQPHVRLEGVVLGFDEYMNIVLEGAVEVSTAAAGKRGGGGGGGGGGGATRTALGQVLLKGDNVTAMLAAPA